MKKSELNFNILGEIFGIIWIIGSFIFVPGVIKTSFQPILLGIPVSPSFTFTYFSISLLMGSFIYYVSRKKLLLEILSK